MEKFSKTVFITKDFIDANGHVNNVHYVQWMQDIAVEHYAALGGIKAQGSDFTWVVREHRIEYLLPAFESDEVEVYTWVENLRRVRSLRRYEFFRKKDATLLVRGETDWVFVDAASGKPQAIPESVKNILPITTGNTG